MLHNGHISLPKISEARGICSPGEFVDNVCNNGIPLYGGVQEFDGLWPEVVLTVS